MEPSRSVEVVAKEAAELLGRLAGDDLSSLTDGEIREYAMASSVLVNLANAAHTRAVGALDARAAYDADGAQTAAAWVRWKCHLPHARARATVRCARSLRHMPHVEAAFVAGRLTPDHIRLLDEARSANEADFAVDEAHLAGLGEDLSFQGFATALRYWRHLHDADGVEDDARRRYLGRRAHCSTTFEDMVRLDAMFEPIGGAIFRRELDRLEHEEFEADWAEARARLGDTARTADLVRTAPQRRADALVKMAWRSAAKAPGATEARILLSVLAGEATLARVCELSDGTVVTPGEVLPLLHGCELERIVFDGPSRVIDVGVRQRFFAGATRRAVEVRDRRCVHDSCDTPADQCQVHHDQPVEHGGLTTQANGKCLCPFHHRHHHRANGPPD